MSDFDDLDSLLGPLREPATPAELASERAMVDLMANSHRHAKGNTMFSSRRARVATLIAAGVIGFGGVAAAGGGLRATDPDGTPDVTPAPQEIEVEEIEADVVEVEEVDEVTTTTAEIEELDDDAFTDEVARATLAAAAQDVGVDDVDDPETAFDENDCLEGNHGRTVSAVAHGDDPFQDVEVRDAAQSQCGKADDADEVDEAAEVDDADEDAAEVEDADDDADEVDDDDADEVDDDDADDSVDEDHGSDDAGRGSSGDRGNSDHANGGRGKSGDD